jgi:hypothetical protein
MPALACGDTATGALIIVFGNGAAASAGLRKIARTVRERWFISRLQSVGQP